MADALPIVERFPALARLPRAGLLSVPTRVDRVTLADGRALTIKRDDLSSEWIGGNKVRGLDWLLGDVRAGDDVLTVGPRGSTHALTTAICARRLGARTTVVRWNQHMNDAAVRVDRRIRGVATIVDALTPVAAYPIAMARRLGRRTRWIPAGGSTPVAILGHVNAALELADQIARGECEQPEVVVVPLGTGGTAAGLALGFRIAGLATRVLAARVVPWILGRAGRVIALANETAGLIERLTGSRVERLSVKDIDVAHDAYGPGYGKPAKTHADESALAGVGIGLDDTYSRKAFATAAAVGRQTLFWLTFDGRLLQD